MIKGVFFFFLLFARLVLQAQIPTVVSVEELREMENYLASDELEGRKAGKAGADSAAEYIAAKFKKARLQPFNSGSYMQHFNTVRQLKFKAEGVLDGKKLKSSEIHAVSMDAEIDITENSGYEVRMINTEADFRKLIFEHIHLTQNVLCIFSTRMTKEFNDIRKRWVNYFGKKSNTVAILTKEKPRNYHLKINMTLKIESMQNVIGILPGKSKRNEWVLYTAHYDHIGVVSGGDVADRVYNGADDNASGTSAVMALAKHYAALGPQERTLVFIAFSGEEAGLLGSSYFGLRTEPTSMAAMINIEMIGLPGPAGFGNAYITGPTFSNMMNVMNLRLKPEGAELLADPFPEERLFARSDNAPLAYYGVPAHTIMSAPINRDPYYHQTTDEVSTLNFNHMQAVINMIAFASQGLVDGTERLTSTHEKIRP